jgi:hypothetical protein
MALMRMKDEAGYMGRYGVLVLLSLALMSTNAKAWDSAKELLANYDSASAEKRNFLEAAVNGIEYGLLVANVYLETKRKEKPLYCPPSSYVSSGDKIIAMLRQELVNDPALEKYPIPYVVLSADMRTFPCKNSN